MPADKPSPSHSECDNTPPKAVFIHFGTAAVYWAPPNFWHRSIVQIGNRTLLSLDRTPRGLAVSAEIFDQDGILVQIIKGKFTIYRAGVVNHERPDSHTLIVYDKWNNLRLQVQYLNPYAVNITGTFFYPGHDSITVNDTTIIENRGKNTMSGGCFGGEGTAIFLD